MRHFAGGAVLNVGRDGLKSRFGKTKALGGGKYEYREKKHVLRHLGVISRLPVQRFP